MKAVKWSMHLWALRNVTTGEYAQEWDEGTQQMETAVFPSKRSARFWAAERDMPLFQ